MHSSLRVAAIALALGAATILTAQDKCATCGGSVQVKCYQFGGKPGSQGPCAACGGTGGAACAKCNGEGRRPCALCSGTGRIRAFKCAYCEGVGAHACKLCDKGRAKCPVCTGTGNAPVSCDVCARSGGLRCPECASDLVPCPPCKGTSNEECPVCKGKGETTSLCASCQGRRKDPCAVCDAFGNIVCEQCKGLGAKTVKGEIAGPEILQQKPCAACKKAGELPCASCKGQGTTPCKTCAGKGTGTAPCWLCEGGKTLPCRRCGGGRVFRGASLEAGVRCAVFDCSAFQPRLARGWKNALRFGDCAVWRVVIDARESHARFALGGEDGWEIVLVGASGSETPMIDAYAARSAKELNIVEAWLEGGGDVMEALKRPFGVAGGDVRTCLALTPKATEKDATMFRLRRRDGSVQPVDLVRSEASWSDWVRERILACER